MTTRFSAIVVTYRRDDVLAGTLARLAERCAGGDVQLVLVDNNCDGVDRGSFLAPFGDRGILVVPAANGGCTGGRNAGIAAAAGDVLVLLDDDALVETPDLPGTLERLFSSDPRLGIVAFKSVNGHTGRIDAKEFPHTDKALDPETPFETFRFIGVGHAMRRTLIDEIGLYREDFFYGMEEFELSFRAMRSGWRIRYEPSCAVLHMKHPDGRLPPLAAVRRHYVNKLKIAWMHLPTGVAAATVAAWTLKSLVMTRGRLPLVSSLGEVLRWIRLNSHLRRPDGRVIGTIRQLGGSAWK